MAQLLKDSCSHAWWPELIPNTQMTEEKNNLPKLSSDLNTGAHTHTHIKKKFKY